MSGGPLLECAACGHWKHPRWMVSTSYGNYVCRSGPACDRRRIALGLKPLGAL